jgi:hypothetical protein
MRSQDFYLAILLRNHWKGRKTSKVMLCPLLADLDQLLAYLDEAGLKPGHAIGVCPKCGEEHRWALLKELMIYAKEIRPDSQHRLIEMVDRSLDSERAMYGGEEGFREFRKEEEAFFMALGASTLKANE